MRILGGRILARVPAARDVCGVHTIFCFLLSRCLGCPIPAEGAELVYIPRGFEINNLGSSMLDG